MSLGSISTFHGLLAWLGVLATAASAWLASRRAPRRLLLTAAIAATSLLTASGALGLLLHAPYQSRLRQRVFLQSPRIGWLFERKEHLSFGALALSWCALAALIALELRERRRIEAPADPVSTDLHRTVVRAYAASAFLAAAAAAASAVVAHRHSF